MADDWDADDFDPDAGFAKEDDEEDLAIAELKVTEPVKLQEKVPKKSKAERLEEKKMKRKETELSQKAEEKKIETVADKMAEKERLRLQQEESEIETVKDLFRVTEPVEDPSAPVPIEAMFPNSPDEWDRLETALTTKLKSLESSPYYLSFMDSFLRSVCAGLDAEDLKKLGTTLTFMANEKLKVAKAAKPKKKGKATLSAAGKVARRQDYDNYEDGDLGAEFDDFI